MSLFPIYLLQNVAGRDATRPGMLWGVLLAAPLLLVTSGKADASCGDWLVHTPVNAASSLGEYAASGDSTRRSEEAARPESDRGLPKPCNGPNCRGGSKTPAPPVPPSTSQISKIYCCHPQGDDDLRDDSSQDFRRPLSDAALTGYAFRIDRPPRFLSL